jgi:hypothetical protein
MRITVSLLLLALPSIVLGASSPYCQGNFAVNNAHCKKFNFDELKSLGQCTDSKKTTSGSFKGMKLTNCTT